LIAAYPRGCPPPSEAHWHEWADAQALQGLTQTQCTVCQRWGFPQEQRLGMCLQHNLPDRTSSPE